MTEAVKTARRILERTGDHPVLSLHFDLDPAEFATAPARATQLRSLVDEARAEIERDSGALGWSRTATGTHSGSCADWR